MSGVSAGLKHENKKILAWKSLHDSSLIKDVFPFKFFQNTAYK